MRHIVSVMHDNGIATDRNSIATPYTDIVTPHNGVAESYNAIASPYIVIVVNHNLIATAHESLASHFSHYEIRCLMAFKVFVPSF